MRNHLVSPVLHDRAAVVTLDPVAATSAVGRTLKLRGTVRGGAVEIKIQRSYATGGWTTVAKKNSTRKGTYAARVPLVRGGPTRFRVLKSGTGFKSTVGSVAVYQWLDLTTQPHLQGGFSLTGQPVRIHGRTFPTAVQTMSSGVTAVKLKGLCTVFEGYTGFLDSDLGKIAPGDTQRFDGILLGSGGSQIGPVHGYDTPAGPAVRRAVGITGAAAFLFGSSVNVASPPTTGYVHGVVASPRVYCNAARLPAVDDALINSIP